MSERINRLFGSSRKEDEKKPGRDFYKMLFSITIPIALQNVISYSVNMMDTVMLGTIGEVAISAASLANQVFFIFLILVFGIGGGAVVLCSQYWGRGEIEPIRTVTAISLRVTIVASILYSAVIFCFPAAAMRIFTPDPAVIEAGAGYLRLVSLSYFFYGVTSCFLMVLRAVETVKMSIWIYSASFAVNVFFNYLFIFGKMGAPALGVKGAAVGTVLARLSEFIMMLLYVRFFEKKIRFRLPMLKLRDPVLAHDMLHYGIPVFLNETLWSLGNSAHAVILGHMSAQAVAANSICNTVFQVATSFIFGVSNASAVVTGKVIGTGDIPYLHGCVRQFKKIYLAVGILSAGVILAIKTPLISLYNIAPETVIITHQLMCIYAACIFFMSFTCAFIMGVFRGSGDTRFAMAVDVGCIWLFIPFGAAAAFLFHLSPLWVFLILRLEMPLKMFLCLYHLRNDNWIKNVTR